ncbi:hypothetical protein CPL00368_CDS0070 [Klebsiella phage DevonBitter]
MCCHIQYIYLIRQEHNSYRLRVVELTVSCRALAYGFLFAHQI